MNAKLLLLHLTVFCAITRLPAQVSKSHDFDDYSLSRLLAYPGDPTRMIGVKTETDFENEFYFTYMLKEIGEDYSFDIFPDMVEEIVSEPLVYYDRLIFSAKGDDGDHELFVFDGSGTVKLDINPGDFSSQPRYDLVGDKLFVTAQKGQFRQLFELDEHMELHQLSFEEEYNASQVVRTGENEVIYTTEADTNYFSRIRKYSAGLTQTLLTTKASYIYDRMDFNGIFFFHTNLVVEDVWTALHYEIKQYFSMAQDIPDLVLRDSSVQPSYRLNETFILDNRMYMRSSALSVQNQDTVEVLYQSHDGLNFTPIVSLPSYHWFFEFLVKDNTCTIIVEDGWTEHHTVNRFEGDVLEPVYEADYHVHYVSQNADELFLISVARDSTNYKLLKLDFNNNTVTPFLITEYGSHPPYFTMGEDGAEWLNGSLYFISGHSDPLDYYSQDIFKYDPAWAGLTELEKQFSVFPNPLSGDFLQVHSRQAGAYRILSAEGKVIHSGELNTGKNTLWDFETAPGVYILEFAGSSTRFIKL